MTYAHKRGAASMTKNKFKAHEPNTDPIPLREIQLRQQYSSSLQETRTMHAMEKTPASLCLVITLLAFYFLVPSNAIPLSRVQRLLPFQQAGEMPSVEQSTPKPKMDMKRVNPQGDVVIDARMMLETQDYPPSGPNNHHKPPGWS